MRLMRIGPVGNEQPAVQVDDYTYVDVSDVLADFDGAFFASGMGELADVVRRRIDAGEVHSFTGEERIGAPLARPHQILCIGLNFSDHAAETGQAVPQEPIVFTKSPNTLVGPNDDVLLPRGATKTDWEVELGVVIGRRASYVEEADALAHVAGYCVINDLSERDFQLNRSGTWDKGKGCDTFGPVGPWLVTPDEVGDPQDLAMWLEVNGRRVQDGSTRTMAYGVARIVS